MQDKDKTSLDPRSTLATHRQMSAEDPGESNPNDSRQPVFAATGCLGRRGEGGVIRVEEGTMNSTANDDDLSTTMYAGGNLYLDSEGVSRQVNHESCQTQEIPHFQQPECAME